jgi:Flp pilus assembly protein TadD
VLVGLPPQAPYFCYPISGKFRVTLGRSTGRADEAIATLVTASAKHPADTDILAALASFCRDRGNEAKARRYMEQLRVVAAGL